MIDIKVSIIVLVYNTEKYLDKCLDSIVNQTLEDIEIICIDDKSSDNSVSIIKKYRENDDRIILVENESNLGIGVNRDIGIKMSRGEYIGFVDSDDYIDKDYYLNLYSTAKKYNSDIVKTENIEILNKNYDKKTNLNNNDDINEGNCNLKTYELINALNNYKKRKYHIVTTVWSKLFKKDFILLNNISHMELKNGEDLCFVLGCLAHKPSISINNNSIYYCVQRNEFGVHIKNNDYVGDAIKIFYASLNEYYSNSRIYIGYVFDLLMYILFSTVNDLYTNNSIKNEYMRVIDLFTSIQLSKEDLKKSNFYFRYIYFKLLKNKDYKTFCKCFFYNYKKIRTLLPPPILNMLRDKNIIP